jgi:hypothetical protein
VLGDVASGFDVSVGHGVGVFVAGIGDGVEVAATVEVSVAATVTVAVAVFVDVAVDVGLGLDVGVSLDCGGKGVPVGGAVLIA